MKKYYQTIFQDKSEFLDGAIAVSGDAPVFTGGISEGASVVVEWIAGLVDDTKFKLDHEHDIFVNENGAVANAYDFYQMNEDEIKEATADILVKMADRYPDYEFKMVPGEFPVATNYEFVKNSTHVLYISDYEKHLVKDNKELKLK